MSLSSFEITDISSLLQDSPVGSLLSLDLDTSTISVESLVNSASSYVMEIVGGQLKMIEFPPGLEGMGLKVAEFDLATFTSTSALQKLLVNAITAVANEVPIPDDLVMIEKFLKSRQLPSLPTLPSIGDFPL